MCAENKTRRQGVCADGVIDVSSYTRKQTKLGFVFCGSLADVCVFEKREKQDRTHRAWRGLDQRQSPKGSAHNIKKACFRHTTHVCSFLGS